MKINKSLRTVLRAKYPINGSLKQRVKMRALWVSPIIFVGSLLIIGALLGLTSSTYAGVTVDGAQQFRQTVHQFYEDSNSVVPGSQLAWTDTNAKLQNTGDTFRLRTGVEVASTKVALIPFTAISRGGYSHSCAISSLDSLGYCWGAQSYGSLGNGVTSTNIRTSPVAVSTSGALAGKTLKSIVAIHAFASCAIASDDKLYCWGKNTYGMIGNNSTVDSNVPIATNTSGVMAGKDITQVSIQMDGYRTCARSSDGNAYCWGQNTYGELGNGLTSHSTVPVQVSLTGALAGKTIKYISAGTEFTCAIASDDQVYCWGRNHQGQLGNNSLVNSTTPVAVTTSGALAGKTIKSLSVGHQHACVLASDDMVYCWGDDFTGSLGGNTTDSSVPVMINMSGVLAGKTINSLAVSGQTGCVIASDQRAYCWGQNGFYELGNGTTTNSSQPVAVSTSGALSGKSFLGFSDEHSVGCVRATDNYAYCWGQNRFGPNGNGTAGDNNSQPTRMNPGNAISAVAAGSNSYILQYAKKATGNSCSAQTGYAQITESTPIAFYNNPSVADRAAISDLGNSMPIAGSRLSAPQHFVDTSASFTTSAPTPGVTLSATASYYSYNGHAALWDFSLKDNFADPNSTYCIRVAYADGTALESSYQDTPEIKTAPAGTFTDTGSRFYEASNSTTPGSPLGATDVGAQLASSNQDFRLRTGIASTPPDYNIKTLTVAFGSGHVCGIDMQDRAVCWGDGAFGALGTGSEDLALHPTLVDQTGVLAGKTIKQIGGGRSYGCALASDDQVYCWGYGGYGQLGNGSTSYVTSPVAVDTSGVLAGKTIKSLSVGYTTACIIASDDRAYCWGTGWEGQLGDGISHQSSVPVAVDTSGVLAGKSLRDISVSEYHTCAVDTDGATYCWGENYYGQLGNNSFTGSLVPVAVSTSGVLSGVEIEEVVTDIDFTCARSAAGAAYCWGYGGEGSLGNGLFADSEVPVAVTMSGVLAGKTLTSLSSGGQLAVCGIASDDRAYCWGAGWDGQLGNGLTDNSAVPVAVDTTGLLAGKTLRHISTGGYDTTCVVAVDNDAYCWGYGGDGGLGNGTTDDSLAPIAVVKATYLLNPGVGQFRLEYARLTAATCSVQTTSFAPVTTSTPIAFSTVSSVAHGTAVSTSANDPVVDGATVTQTLVSSAGSISNVQLVPANDTALWDYSLRDNNALASTTYCLRMAYSDGDVLDAYSHPMSVRTAGVSGGTEEPVTEVLLPTLPNESKQPTDPALSEGALITETTGGFTCLNIDNSSVSLLSGQHLTPPPNVRILGGISYTLFCLIEGGVARVSLVLGMHIEDLSALRIYKEEGGLTDITSKVELSNQNYNGATRTFITYVLTDGGEFDEDGIIDGTIVDPVYVGLYEVNGAPGSSSIDEDLAETGIDSIGYLVAGVIGLVLSIGMALRLMSVRFRWLA